MVCSRAVPDERASGSRRTAAAHSAASPRSDAGLAGPRRRRRPRSRCRTSPDEVDFEGLHQPQPWAPARARSAWAARSWPAPTTRPRPPGTRRASATCAGRSSRSSARATASSRGAVRRRAQRPVRRATRPTSWRSPTRSSSGAVQLSYQRVFSFRGDARPSSAGTHVPARRARAATTCSRSAAAGASGRTLRVGGTVNRWFNGYSQRRAAHRPRRVGEVRRDSTEQDIDYDLDSGINFNLGVMWTPIESLNVGAVGKTPFTAILDLRRFRQRHRRCRRTRGLTTNAAERSDVLIDFPGAVGVGAVVAADQPAHASPRTTRARSGRKDRIRNFFRLDADTPDPVRRRPRPTSASCPTRRWTTPIRRTPQQFRLGVEYVLIAGPLKIPLRAGVFRTASTSARPTATRRASGASPRARGSRPAPS